ncbi:MAG: TraU family protein [Gammaproteobacteria bacterium]
MRLFVRVVLLLMPFPSVAATCGPSFINPITDIVWPCIFPINVGGVAQVNIGAPDDPDPISNPICVCAVGAIPTIGVRMSFWEPSMLIDTVKDPFCFQALGVQLPNPFPGRGHGSMDASARGLFAQAHLYEFPAWAILDLFVDLPCLSESEFDVVMMTEILPTWNNDILAMLINPEAGLFANPAAHLACAADAASTLRGRPIDELFWCMGPMGTYPLTGNIPVSDQVLAHSGLAARLLYVTGRTGLLRDPGVDACGSVYTPIWQKSHYRLQLAKPVRDHTCRPIGLSGLVWTHNKNPPTKGDNFAHVIFQKNQCCLTY